MASASHDDDRPAVVHAPPQRTAIDRNPPTAVTEQNPVQQQCGERGDARQQARLLASEMAATFSCSIASIVERLSAVEAAVGDAKLRRASAASTSQEPRFRRVGIEDFAQSASMLADAPAPVIAVSAPAHGHADGDERDAPSSARHESEPCHRVTRQSRMGSIAAAMLADPWLTSPTPTHAGSLGHSSIRSERSARAGRSSASVLASSRLRSDSSVCVRDSSVCERLRVNPRDLLAVSASFARCIDSDTPGSPWPASDIGDASVRRPQFPARVVTITASDDGDDGENGLAQSAAPPSMIPSLALSRQPVTWRDRFAAVRGVSPAHPLVTALDVLYILTTLLATCVALEATVLPDAGPTGVPVARAILLCCHAFMLVWTATRFLVHTCDGWDVCATAGDIAKVYARGWLRFDAVVALPLDWPLAWAYPPAFFGLQLRHALRFARFPSLAHSGNPLASSRRGLRLLAQLVVVALVVDVCAVLFARARGETFWTALYWAVGTATSGSYGDVLPGTGAGARVVACCTMMAGVAMIACLTAGFTAALTRQDARMQAEDDRKQLLASMLAYYEVPWDEQMELIAMFPAVLDAENRRSFKGLLENLPGFMVEKIEGFAMAKAVTESIPLFRDCERGALSDLTRRLDHRFYQAGEVIVQAGAEGFEMYFLVRGTADVLASLPAGVTAVVATLRNGAFFGEVALVTESCVRTASVVAVTPAEVLVLDKQAYLELVAAHASIGRVFDAVTEQARARAAANQKKPDCESEAEDAAPALALSCSTADAHSAACTNNDNGSGDPDADQPLKLPADSYSSTAGRGPPTVTSAHPPPPSGNDDGDGDGSDGGQFSNPFASR